MIKHTYFSNKQGSGYICNDETEIYTIICPGSFTMGNESIENGQETDLAGFFNRDLLFVGLASKFLPTKLAIFYIGTDGFGRFFYQEVTILSNERIFLLYGNGFGRDYNLKEGKWK